MANRHLERRISRNFSSGRAAPIRLIVAHDTEGHDRPGVGDLIGLGDFFDQPGVQASAHKAVDAEGNRCTYVEDGDKAFHVCSYNSYALGLEQLGFASNSEREWFVNHFQMLLEASRTFAEWSIAHGVPLRKGRVAGGRVLRAGVVRHSDLGFTGCGHSDPGPGYPLKFVVQYARYIVLHRKGRGHTRKARALARAVRAKAAEYGQSFD